MNLTMFRSVLETQITSPVRLLSTFLRLAGVARVTAVTGRID